MLLKCTIGMHGKLCSYLAKKSNIYVNIQGHSCLSTFYMNNISSTYNHHKKPNCINRFNKNSIFNHRKSIHSQNRMMSSTAEEDVLFVEKDTAGIVHLNRPKALNSLNENMLDMIYKKLKDWRNKKTLVIVKGSGGKAFCAGGDVVAVTKGKKGQLNAVEFFRKEYNLNHLIGTYQLPYISFITGIVMGGGCGISINGKYRVASEKSMFAMPETAIGLFPDVGGSHFLNRLGSGGLGMFLGLTGQRLRGGDLVRAGLATHYCPPDKLAELEAALLSLPSNASHEHVATLLDNFHEQPSEFSLSPHLKDIKECFTAPTLDELVNRLKQNDSDFCRSQLATIQSCSPTSLVITFEQLMRGVNLSFEDCLKMEYRIVNGIYQDNDFFEGVRAKLVDKDNKPQWQPPTLADVDREATIKKYFDLLPQNRELVIDHS